MKKIQAVVIKASAQYKVGDRLEVEQADFDQLSTDGVAILATVWDANERVRKANESLVVKAVNAAVTRQALVPKGDAENSAETVKAKALEQISKGADVEFVVGFIDGLQPKGEVVTAARVTTFQHELNGNAPGDIRINRADPVDCAIKACEARKPIEGLVKAGQIAKAIEASRESSVILAREIMPLVNRGGDFTLKEIVRAADVTDANVGTIATGLILMKNLGFLRNIINFMPYISTDFRNEPATFNQPIFTRYITPPAVTSYNTTTGWGDSTPSTTDVTVTINNHKGVQVTFQTQLLGSTVRALLSEQQGAQTYALGEQVVKDFLTALFGATWSGTVTNISLGNNFNLASMVTLKNRATLSKLPAIGRFALLHSFYHDGILTDGNLVTAKAITALVNKDMSALESAELPVLYGIKPLESQLASAKAGVLTAPTISADGATVDFAGPQINQVGFLGNMASMLMAARIPQDYTQAFKDIPSSAAIEIVTDPDSGLSMLNCRYVNHQLAQVSNRLSLMYGFAQGDPRQGIVLKP